MRILFLTHRLPYPPNKGDKIRSFNILSYMAARHHVTLASPIDDAADAASVSVLLKKVSRVISSRIYRWLDLPLALLEVFFGRSITNRYFYSRQLQHAIDRMLDGEDIDAVFCFSSPMAEYIDRSRHASGKLAGVIKVMDLIDVDSLKWTQYASRSRGLKAWIYGREAAVLGRFEQHILDTFDEVILVSDQEKRHLPAAGKARVSAVSNGVDLEYFKPDHVSGISRDRPNVVFTGVMDYWPNVEGMEWFLANVFPLIREAVPGVRLYIVGSKPGRQMLKWHNGDSVIVTGFVEDIRDYLAAATVCVAPLRIARGVQNKVLEAMAMARAVVSSPEAFEGIEACAGTDLLVAADAEGFAASVVQVLGDAKLASRIGASARRLVETRYGWESNLRVLDRVLGAGGAEPLSGTV